MSRGVKDLRDLICVSRLTVRHSDEEMDFSDNEYEGRLSRAFDVLSVSSASESLGSRQNSAASEKEMKNQTPDSGFTTNGISPEMEITGLENKPSEGARPKSRKKRKKRKRKSGGESQAHVSLPVRHELPKRTPLPPVGMSRGGGDTTDSDDSDSFMMESQPIGKSSNRMSGDQMGNFDSMLMYMDATLVSEWLNRANGSVTEMTEWCLAGDNFVQFAHFWLGDFPQLQRQEILQMEYSFLVEEFKLAFEVGREAGKVKHSDITHLMEAVYREFPKKFLSTKGSYMFLNYLDILTSERQVEYKTLLSDVKCSTKNKQHAQWLLAARSFCLVNVWTAVLNFYKRLTGSQPAPKGLPMTLGTALARADIHQQRMYHAIRNGFVEVVHYFLKSGRVKSSFKDIHDRTWIFTAVVQNQPRVLQYLLSQANVPDPNHPCDTGNTPLHAAANNGNVVIVTTLLKNAKINVNATNPHCENATPLHLAVMHGHKNVVEVLLCAKADKTARMGDLTPVDIARDFGHDEIYQLLKKSE